MKAGVLATSYSKIGGARHIFSNDTSLHVLLVGCNVSVERLIHTLGSRKYNFRVYYRKCLQPAVLSGKTGFNPSSTLNLGHGGRAAAYVHIIT